MTEIFKPRKNMVCDGNIWKCRDKTGKYICDGGPSVIWNEGRKWQFWIDGEGYHRLDGPAESGGDWWINNKNVTEEIHEFAEDNNIDLENLTDEDKILIARHFS